MLVDPFVTEGKNVGPCPQFVWKLTTTAAPLLLTSRQLVDWLPCQPFFSLFHSYRLSSFPVSHAFPSSLFSCLFSFSFTRASPQQMAPSSLRLRKPPPSSSEPRPYSGIGCPPGAGCVLVWDLLIFASCGALGKCSRLLNGL